MKAIPLRDYYKALRAKGMRKKNAKAMEKGTRRLVMSGMKEMRRRHNKLIKEL